MTGLHAKQKTALKKLNDKNKVYYLHEGGARSGKTFLDSDFFIRRALHYKNTRQLICRASKTSCIASAWMQTLLPILENDYKGLWKEDQSKRIIHFVNGSTIWAGGFDNRQHLDELLAKEWAGILIEEATELRYGNFIKLLTRLNWNPELSKIPLIMILECNPITLSSWIHKYFYLFIDFETKEKLSDSDIKKIEKTHFHPEDNAENLSLLLLEKLRNLKGMAKKRFYDGVWADSFEGQIYEFNRDVNLVPDKIPYNPHAELWRTWDFGINPSDTVIIWIQICTVPKSEEFPEGFKIQVIDEYVNNENDYKHYVDICNSKIYYNDEIEDSGDPAGSARNESLESWFSKLKEHGIYIKTPKGKPSVDDYISNANEYLPYMRVCESQCPQFVEAIENWSRQKDRDGRVIEGSKPEHNEYSHPGTAFYYFHAVRFGWKKSRVILP